MDIERGDPEPSWGGRLRDFSQDTTFHGVRYLGAHTRLLRKLIWCLAIMGSTSLFLYITIENIKKIYTYPKTVNVDVTYKDKLPFPAVTICNNNPLRITEAFHKGLYDDLLEHYQPDAVTQGLGGDEYTYVPVCMADYRDLVNQSEWTYAYSGVTAIGCQHLCTRLHPNHCTSLAYDRSGMSCVLTSNSLEDAGGNSTEEGAPGCASGPTYVDWYRRIRALQVNFEITCDFEESACPLTNIESADEKVETWNEVMVAGHKPSKDHTTGSAFGSFTQMGITSNRQGYVSAMRSAFYQFDDMCLELFYAQTGELAVGFSVKTISEDLRVDALFGVQAGEYDNIDLTEALTDSDDSSSSSSDSYGSSSGSGSSSGTGSYSNSGTNSYDSSSTGSGTNSYSGSYSGGVTRRRRKKRQTSGSGSYSGTSGGTSGSTGGTSGSYSGTSGSTGGTSGSTGGSSSSVYIPSSSSNGITFTQIDQEDDSNEPVVQPEPSIEWKRVYNQLPRGVYQLEIEAVRPNGSEKTSGIVVDDISIWPCAKFRRNCKRFSDGSDFRGSTSMTTSGETCAPWNDVISDQLEQWATFKPSESSNHCRNLASDAKGPGCYVLHPTGYYTYEHCTIPYCGCGPRSFTCDDGQCILKSLTCNGAFDCIDGSDELTACTAKRQVTCDFESDFICGYQVSTWSSTRWRATKIIQLGQSTDATEDYYGSDQGTILDLDVKSPLEGDTVTVTTPVHNSTEDLCLTFQFYKYRHVMDTIAQLRVYRDQTLLWSDGAHRCPQESYVCSGWSEAELLLPRGRYNVVFEATLGLGESTDYAIDNVKVMDIVDCPTVSQTLPMNDTSDAGNTTLTNGTESGNETETNETATTVAPNPRVGPDGAGGAGGGGGGGGGDPRGAAPYTGTCTFRSGDQCGYTVHSSNQRFSWDLIAEEFILTYLQSLQDNPNTGCHTEYWTKTGRFETVNFPNSYTAANCRYRIKSVAGSTIYINFLHFHLENAYSGRCTYDSVNFYELGTQNPLSPTVCGLQKPFSLTFANVSGVDVVFKADYYDSFSGFTAQYTIMEVPGEHYKMVVKSAVTASKEHVTTSLISPMLNHDSGEHCLGFTVLIKAAFEVNLRHEDGTLEELWRVRDGVYSQFTVFRLVIVPLPRGKYQIEFRTDFLPRGMPASLSDIGVLPFNCLQPGTGLVKPEVLSCDFKTVTICGYIDVSDNPERWIQNFYYENLVNDTKLREDYDAGRLTFLTQPMNDTTENATYINDTSTLRALFIETYFNGTLDNVDYSFISGSSLPVYRTIVGGMSCDEDSKNIICLLVSRPVNATEPHCMQFRYYFAYITTQLGFFIINEVNGANQTNQTETYVALGSIQSDTTSRGPADFVKVKEWQRGQVELPEGVYRVMITASDVVGFGATRLGEISVTNGSCGHIEDVRNVTVLSSDDGWMTLNDTTSSQGGGRDGSKNNSGWDPWPNNNTIPTTQTRTVRPRKSVAGDMDMSTFFIAASHSLEDMLISCNWDGVNCSIDDFVREYTGLGVCYTFNQDKNKILESTRTGAQFGLSLVLNTEQYEQAPSETTDAGIKVHLHSQEDVPTITDTGTAIPLSMHSFISVTYAKTETLPDPYSNCTEAKHTVEFYENDPYTVARCRRHCDAERVTGFCNCKMLHLPGPTRFCTMQEYFTCLRHVQQNSTNSCPMCTDACSIKAYSTDTSYATLSSNSIEQLLKQNTDLLEASYHKALDVRSRADPTILVDQIQRVKEIIDQLRRVLKLTDQHASQGQLSAFTFGKQALTHFVNMVVRDIQSGFDNIDTFKLDYMLGYGQRRVNLVQGLDGIRANLTSVLDLKEYANSSPRLTARVNGLQQACSDVADLVDIILNEDKVNDHHQHLNYLPAKVYLTKESKAECTKTITGVKANVGILKTNLLNGNQILDPFNFAIAGYLANASKEIHNCVNEFGEILSSAKSWYDENDFALNDTADILDYNIYFDYNSTTVDLIATLEKYEVMLLQLTEHNLTKLELAQFINAAEINQIEGYLKSTYDTIKKDVYMILENAISKVEKQSITAYQRTLGHLSNIQQFYISDKTKTVFSDQARAMRIFYRPYIFSDSFGSIGFQFKTVPETYVIWPANKDFKEFADHHAQQHLVSLVKGFFGPVKDAMSTAMESILTSSNDVSESMKTFGDSLALYVKSSNLDIQFIQDSFLKLDIYYGELKYEAIQQQEAYGVVAFFTEMGGTMGLLIGASVLTICEVIDFFLFTAFKMITARRVRPKSHRINVSPPPPYKESL